MARTLGLGAQHTLDTYRTSQKLKAIQKKKKEVLRGLEVIAIFNIILLLVNILFFSATMLRLFIDRYKYPTSDEKLLFVAIALLNLLNIIAIVLFLVGSMFKIWNYITAYMTLNTLWMFVVLVTALGLYIKREAQRSDEDKEDQQRLFGVLILTFIYCAINGVMISTVNMFMKRLRIYNKTFSRTLSFSRSTSESLGTVNITTTSIGHQTENKPRGKERKEKKKSKRFEDAIEPVQGQPDDQEIEVEVLKGISSRSGSGRGRELEEEDRAEGDEGETSKRKQEPETKASRGEDGLDKVRSPSTLNTLVKEANKSKTEISG